MRQLTSKLRAQFLDQPFEMGLHVPAVEVLEFISDRRFHQSFVLPPNPETGRTEPHHFSYADFGDSTSNAVVFFCGGLMCPRFGHSSLDGLVRKHNVRFIQVDRPGIGRTDAIALEQRVQIWLGQSCCSLTEVYS
jgi:hypothetical protein